MAKKNSSENGTSIFRLILMFVEGFAVFSLLGFIIIIILLSAGILPAM